MEAWWSSLDTIARIYWVIAICATSVTVVQLGLSLIGLDGSGDWDVDGAAEHGSGLGLLSTRALTAFFSGFGWAGVLAHGQGLSLIQSLAIAVAVGVVMLFAMVRLMQGLHRLRHDGTVDYRNTIGSEAEVYIPIPPASSGHGQVTTTVQGRFRVIDARTDDAERLDRGARVRVLDVAAPSTLVVTALANAPAAPVAEASNH